MDEEVVGIEWLDGLYASMRARTEVEVADLLSEGVGDDRVAHLPERERSAFEELFYAVPVVLEEAFRAGSLVRHGDEDGLLNLLVDDLLLVATVQ